MLSRKCLEVRHRKYEETGEICIMWGFVICTSSEMLV